jgi:hypothetical protein
MKMKKIKVGPYLKAVPVVVGIGLAGFTGYAGNVYADTYKSNAQQIQNLKADISTLSSQGVVTPKEVEDVVTNASDAGRAVADLQNKYASLAGDEDAIKANAAEIKKYFNDTSSNAGAIWLQNGTWTFRTSYSFNEDTLDCLWTCVDADGNLLGYATAQYTGKDKVFSGFTKTITTKGNSSTSVTHDRPEDDAEKVQSTVDAIKQQVGNTTSNVSEKDVSDIFSAREQMRQQQGGN